MRPVFARSFVREDQRLPQRFQDQFDKALRFLLSDFKHRLSIPISLKVNTTQKVVRFGRRACRRVTGVSSQLIRMRMHIFSITSAHMMWSDDGKEKASDQFASIKSAHLSKSRHFIPSCPARSAAILSMRELLFPFKTR